jgi:hypothetical protein
MTSKQSYLVLLGILAALTAAVIYRVGQPRLPPQVQPAAEKALQVSEAEVEAAQRPVQSLPLRQITTRENRSVQPTSLPITAPKTAKQDAMPTERRTPGAPATKAEQGDKLAQTLRRPPAEVAKRRPPVRPVDPPMLTEEFERQQSQSKPFKVEIYLELKVSLEEEELAKQVKAQLELAQPQNLGRDATFGKMAFVGLTKANENTHQLVRNGWCLQIKHVEHASGGWRALVWVYPFVRTKGGGSATVLNHHIEQYVFKNGRLTLERESVDHSLDPSEGLSGGTG